MGIRSPIRSQTHGLKPGDGCRGKTQSGNRHGGDRIPRAPFVNVCPAFAFVGGVTDRGPGGAGGVGNCGIGGETDIVEAADNIAHQCVFAAEQVGAAGDVEPD
jgi:hypothetical protein